MRSGMVARDALRPSVREALRSNPLRSRWVCSLCMRAAHHSGELKPLTLSHGLIHEVLGRDTRVPVEEGRLGKTVLGKPVMSSRDGVNQAGSPSC